MTENRIEKYLGNDSPMSPDEYLDRLRGMIGSVISVGQRFGVPVFTPASFPPIEQIQAENDYARKLELMAQGADEWARQLTLLAATCRSEKNNNP